MVDSNFEKMLEIHRKLQEAREKELRDDPLLAEAERLFQQAREKVHSAKRYDPVGAIELMTQAVQLKPEYERQMKAIECIIEQKARKGPVRVSKTLKAKLIPKILANGFAITDNVAGHFRFEQKTSDNSALVIDVGPEKFGKRLYFQVCSQVDDQFACLNHGLSWDELQYLNQSELEIVVDRIISTFDEKVIPWLKEQNS